MNHYGNQQYTTANADESSAKQKDKSDYISELAEHLDVDTNALKAALSDATEAVVKALVIELGPGGGEVSSNAVIPSEYSDGTINGRADGDVVDLTTARERVQTLVANSAGSGSRRGSRRSGGKKLGDMTTAEVHEALDELEDRMVTEEDVVEAMNGGTSPTSNADDRGAGSDVSDYPDGTVNGTISDPHPTGNTAWRPSGNDDGEEDVSDYSDGTIGGDF